MIRLILFDVDGTLIHTAGAGREAFARVFASQFRSPNGTEKIQFAGRTDWSIVREFFLQQSIEPSPEHFHLFFDSYVFWLDHLLTQGKGRVLGGVQELIRALQSLPERPTIGLLTGNIRLGAEIKLRHFGLWDLFQTGGFGDDDEDRGRIAAIARERGQQLLGRKLAGEEVLVVGDTPLDIACARAISAKVLAVATGPYSLGQLQAEGPTWAVPGLEGLEARALVA